MIFKALPSRSPTVGLICPNAILNILANYTPFSHHFPPLSSLPTPLSFSTLSSPGFTVQNNINRSVKRKVYIHMLTKTTLFYNYTIV